MKTLFTVTAACLLVVGCAAPKPVIWNRPGGTQTEFDQDTARCDYETSAATQVTDNSFSTILGREYDRAVRKKELFGKCMVARGWTAQ